MRNPRTAVTTLFFLNGAVFSSFFARLPAIKARPGRERRRAGLRAVPAPPPGSWWRSRSRGWMIARGAARWRRRCRPRSSTARGLPLAALAPSIERPGRGAVRDGAGQRRARCGDQRDGCRGRALAAGARMLSSMHAAFSFGAMAGAGVRRARGGRRRRRPRRTWRSWPSAVVGRRGARLRGAPAERDARTAARPSPARPGAARARARRPSACCWPRAR